MSRGRDKFNKFKPVIMLLVRICSVLPCKMREKLFEHFRMTKGNIGLVSRYVFLKVTAKDCGDNVSIHPNVYMFNIRNLSIGNNVSIHPMCYIDATGGISIGNDVSIAHGATIMSTTHRYEQRDIPIKDNPVESRFTVVENNVWIGAKATVLAGIKVGTGSVIGAGAVVTKDVQENTIVGGVPAIKIKDRIDTSML